MTDTDLKPIELDMLTRLRKIVAEANGGPHHVYKKVYYNDESGVTGTSCFYLEYTPEQIDLVEADRKPLLSELGEIKGPGCLFGHLGADLDPEDYKGRLLEKENACVSTTFIGEQIGVVNGGKTFTKPSANQTVLSIAFDCAQQLQDRGENWGVALTLIEAVIDADFTYPEIAQDIDAFDAISRQLMPVEHIEHAAALRRLTNARIRSL